jgi:aspartyl protease family protein
MTNDFVSLAYTIALLVVVAGIIVALYRFLVQVISAVTLWALLGSILIAAYSYRSDLLGFGNRLLAEGVPSRQILHETTVVVGRTDGRDFAITAEINGSRVSMVLDTGARLSVLTQNDAKAANLPVELLNYTIDIDTANGRTRAAPVTLDRLAIGNVVERSVDALVARPGQLKISLLGMSFLRRLQHWELHGDRLSLVPRGAETPDQHNDLRSLRNTIISFVLGRGLINARP